MRPELKYGLLSAAIAFVINRFMIFPVNVSAFLSGFFFSFGIFLLVVNLLPESTYNRLLYRKWDVGKRI